MRNKFLMTEKAAEGSFVLQNQRPGRIVNGKFVQINIDALSAADKKRLEDDLRRYAAERERKFGKGQLQKDIKTSQKVAAEQEARRKAEADKNKPKPPAPPATQSPPTQPPAGSQQPPAGRSQPTPPAAPARQTPPQASPVAQYMKAAAAARKSGDPAEMAKVRDMGLQIWASTPANKKLAAAAAERERTRGTSATTNPQMAGLKDRLPAPATTTPAAGSALAGNQVKPAFSGTALSSAKPTGASDMSGGTVTDRTPVAYSSTLTQTKGSGLNPPSNTIGDTRSDVLKKGLLKKGDPGWANNARYNVKEKYDAYDLVLEHLLSEGHADTVDEANYVMMQMSAEHIQNIIKHYK